MFRHTVKQNVIGTSSGSPRCVLIALCRAAGAVPHNTALEILRAEDRIHEDFKVVARCFVAVEIDGPCRFEDAPHFGEPLRHIDEIRRHPRTLGSRTNSPKRRMFIPHHTSKALFRLGSPRPHISERIQLRLLFSCIVSPKDRISRLGVERRISVDGIHGCIWPVRHHLKAITVIEGVRRKCQV